MNVPGLQVLSRRRVQRTLALTLLIGTVGVALHADDWPEWRGKGRLGIWNETGILEKFPETGLTYL